MKIPAITRHVALVSAALLALAACAQPRTARGSSNYARALLGDVLRRHPEIPAMELAALSGDGCVTVAATDGGDIGDECGEDETRAMLSRVPHIEEPSDDERAYVVTDAVHDLSGKVAGVIIVDIVVREPGGGRDAALARARVVRRELESRIQSAAQLTPDTLGATPEGSVKGS